MVTGKPTIKVTEDNFLVIEGNLDLVSGLIRRIHKNEQEELLMNILRRSCDDTSLRVYINKQSALNNNIHLIDENMSSLGDIEVNIITRDVDVVIDYLCL